jgi:vitamin B12 transporter
VQDQSNQPKQFSTAAFWMQNKNFAIQRRQDLSQIKAVFEKKLIGISTIRFGGEYWYNNDRTNIHDSIHKLTDNYTSLFAESDIYVTNALAAKVGVRFENSTLINKSDIAPRVSLAYKTGRNAQMSLAYGIFYQKPENNQLYYNATRVGMTKATHYIINYQNMTVERILRLEAYYKKYEDLIKTVPAITYTSYNNDGNGYAKGIDLFWRDKKSIRNFDYWVSYSYIDSKRDYANYPKELQPNFVANHTASLVMKRFFTSIKSGFNFTYTYASGRPYYNVMVNSGNKYFIADEGKTKSYNSLNFSGEYVPSIGKKNAKTNIVLFASMTNVLGANQVYGYNYSYSGMYKEPITPPAKRFYFIGCFLSWGVDRTQDAINNNL